VRRENKQLRLERDILSRAAAWFARETGTIASGSSSSGVRTRRCFRLPRWHACSACRRLAFMRGDADRCLLMPSPRPTARRGCMRSSGQAGRGMGVNALPG